jgi:hypothetical protein
MIEAATTNGGPSATHWEGDRIVFSGTGVILGELEQTVPGFELRAETLARRVLVEDGTAVGDDLSTSRLGVAVWYAVKEIQLSDTETDFHGMPKMAIRYSHPAKDLATN